MPAANWFFLKFNPGISYIQVSFLFPDYIIFKP
jgi:hypothetical protein